MNKVDDTLGKPQPWGVVYLRADVELMAKLEELPKHKNGQV